MTTSDWKIPMDEHGGVIRDPHELTVGAYKEPVKWLPKDTEFKLTLVFLEFYRVTKNSFGILSSQYDKKKTYPFSLPQLFELMKNNVIDHGCISTARYTVIKQGGIYSMQFCSSVDRYLDLAEGDESFALWLSEVEQKLRLPPLDSFDYEFLRQSYDEGLKPLECVLRMSEL